jgi:hypothetical protein
MSLNNNNYLTIPPVYVYFKEAWTTNKKTYLIYPDWTLNQFRDAMKSLVAIDFNMEPDAFDFVLVGQPQGELGSSLPQSNEIKLRDLWAQELTISFYIRRL